MHILMGFLFLIPHNVLAMAGQTEVQKFKTVRDSISAQESGSDSTRRASSKYRSNLRQALAEDLFELERAQAPANSRIGHKRASSVPLVVCTGTTHTQCKQVIHPVAPLDLNDVKSSTPSHSTNNISEQEKQQRELVPLPGVPQAEVSPSLPVNVDPETCAFAACIKHLHQEIQEHVTSGSYKYQLLCDAQDKHAYLKPELERIGRLYEYRMGNFNKLMPFHIEALLESTFPTPKDEPAQVVMSPKPTSCCTIL